MDGVIISPLKKIYHPKGDIFHAIKKSDVGFSGFGEAYFSTINQGDIKGWKKHTEMILNLVVPFGEIEFVVYNEISKKFFNIKISQKNYQRLTVKAGLWLAFKGIGEHNVVLNLSNIEHNENETMNIDLKDINYNWNYKHQK
jgi:dTDP-4-dehydrorhamnose 3,5-epimerase